VARGDVWLSPDMTARVLARTTGQKALDDDPLSLLSDRELQVFELIGHGRTTQEIARELDVSVKTIETHRQNLKTKLGLRNSSELSRCATEWVVQGR
jgi:DNA-binding NarL/FixJ family response regulator